MSYMNEKFLLRGENAQKLYFEYAKDMPIFDYHCHLPEVQILENKPFVDLFEVWLAGDHYKWRLMRNFGVDEEYITGKSVSNKEKFLAYCRVLGTAFGNPLYHWSQAELEEFFGCTLEINEQNAEAIWDMCNAYIRENSVTPQKLIEQSGVSHVFTTNEIFDDLSTFKKIKEKNYAFKVIPAFRADKIMNIEADRYNEFVAKLGDVQDIDALEEIIEDRLLEFIKAGTVASDIALQAVYPISNRRAAAKVFKKRRSGARVSDGEAEIFKGYLTYFLFKLYAKHNIVTELHIGAMRNNNSKMLASLGLDTGFDSIAEDNSVKNMSRLFDALDSEGSLPKTIVFNLNPKMNTEIMTLIGCFQSAEARGKVQYGAAWWFLDNKVGMERHLEDLTATGHIGTFVGMLTDSRSFLSYPRHRYFRRILCNYLGGMMDRGEITADAELVGGVVRDICYNNAITYFGV
ncbi:MAG: glucuronate isomerase [Ruminococcaceae bacterium]|nr:glucuronate isomerase [Oscillospiraceae bacterium]